MLLEKIISGGQTGVDRGALDAALDADFPCGGSCPAERVAEDGAIPARYPVTPLPDGGYRERTLQNVLDSDGTVLICNRVLSGGTRLTRDFCQQHARPYLVIDASLQVLSRGRYRDRKLRPRARHPRPQCRRPTCERMVTGSPVRIRSDPRAAPANIRTMRLSVTGPLSSPTCATPCTSLAGVR